MTEHEHNTSGWQHVAGRRKFVEFRNECNVPVVCNIVKVKATGNYFIYIREKIQGQKDVVVRPGSYEVAMIEESDF